MVSVPSELRFSRTARLPFIRSAESAECGLACLAMIGCYHGHDLDLNGLRQRFSISLAGTTLRGLIGLADRLGLATRALRIELDDLSKVQTPAILHWNLDHFVVLKSTSRRGAVIHDPAHGVRSMTMSELSGYFTGVVLELAPAADFTSLTARTPVSVASLWSRMHGAGQAIAQILALSLALQLLAFAMPFQMQLVVDEAILRSDASMLSTLALAFCGVALIHALIEVLREWTVQSFSHLLGYQLVGNVVRHLMRLPGEYFEKRQTADILSRVNSATHIQIFLTQGAVGAIIDGVMAVAAATILLAYSWPLAVVVLASLAATTLYAVIVFPILRARREQAVVATAREQNFLMETTKAATTIKIMGREAEREGVWRNLAGKAVNASVQRVRVELSIKAFQNLSVSLQTILVLYFGALAVVNGSGFSIGMLVAFLSFRQTLTDRAHNLIDQVTEYRALSVHLDRLADIVTTPADATESGPNLREIEGRIDVRALSFRYGSTDAPVLRNVSVSISAGEFVAITGVSGGGKTTLMKLLLGLREPTSGTIQLDGQEANPGLWRAWREHVGVVAQDDRLLSGTIAENIAFFDPNLSMAKVESAARAARIHDDILRMPMRYLTLVGDMGSTLSGGQRQRVFLARALYREPRVLLLDEGTANLDEHTEELLADLVMALPMTRVVVAHRPALLRRASRVLTIEGGTLIEASSTAKPEAVDARSA